MAVLSRPCIVVLHDDRVSGADVLCGPDVLPLGMLGKLSSPNAKCLYILGKAPAFAAKEISLHARLAERFGYENRVEGTVEIVEDCEPATAAHLELSFHDLRLSRADMWRMTRRLDGTIIYRDQPLKLLDTPIAHVRAVYVDGLVVDSALFSTATTKPIFRSGSSRYTILIQVSDEMLHFWDGGELMYERLISGYLLDLFERWEAQMVRHTVSIVLFGRAISCTRPFTKGEAEGHQDFYHVIATDEPSSAWQNLLRQVKAGFSNMKLPRLVTLATDGNMLEAIHLAVMDFANDRIDPHLSSNGTSIIAVTAGSGLFQTSHATLQSTTYLLMGNSIGVDIVALSPKPLHPIPLFAYTRGSQIEYALPHWVEISFWDQDCRSYDSCWLMPSLASEVIDVAVAPMQEASSLTEFLSTNVMSEYDGDVFGTDDHAVPPTSTGSTPHVKNPMHSKTPSETNKVLPNIAMTDGSLAIVNGGHQTPGGDGSAQVTGIDGSINRSNKAPLPSHSLMTMTRKISLGPKGLAPSKGLASTTISAEHAQHDRELPTPTHFSSDGASHGIARQIRQSLARKPSQQSLASPAIVPQVEASKPINIRDEVANIAEVTLPPAQLDHHDASRLDAISEILINDTPESADTLKGKNDPFYAAIRAAENEGDWDDAPWVTLLNPCNPKRDNMRVAAQYRKWQHVFPRAISSSTFKWTSMCTPAALPLTTEFMPSQRELQKYFVKNTRTLLLPSLEQSRMQNSAELLTRLVMMRLTHGFQISAPESIRHRHARGDENHKFIMSLGNTYHALELLSDTEVQITEYTLNSRLLRDARTAHINVQKYTFYVRSIRKVVADADIALRQSALTWSDLDEELIYPATMDAGQAQNKMRFVLIPVSSFRVGVATPTLSKGLSDEERRIDGIQRLTQLWQRNRYLSPEDQRHQASLAASRSTSTASARDPNPLAIEYHTRDSSAVVNAYGPMLTGQVAGIEHVPPLFPESEMYHTSDFDIARLARQMQEPPPQGVEVRDRRWFARTHPRCFRGDEMVNWLLRVFKDLETRDDAIALGNDLMDRGVFVHVRAKHGFRDGHYFYQIASVHRTTDYPDNVSVFSKTMRSVPATPMSESRPSFAWDATKDDKSSSGRPTPLLIPNDKKEILLSQSLVLNVDPAHSSDQPELVTLHYDRIHNPENGFHIQLEWTSATAILIRDAVTRWSALAENHGLRLVQLPMVEASKLRLQHPFDQPISVKLAIQPPERVPATPIVFAQTTTLRIAEDSLAYQKALLRKLDFVLDYEAAASFTTKLDVRYSYGPPDYELTQFVHKSGLLLAQIVGDDDRDFLLVPNRLAQQRHAVSSKAVETESVRELITSFIAFCRNEEKLKAFYDDVNKPKMMPLSPHGFDFGNLDSDIPPMQLPPLLSQHRTLLRRI